MVVRRPDLGVGRVRSADNCPTHADGASATASYDRRGDTRANAHPSDANQVSISNSSAFTDRHTCLTDESADRNLFAGANGDPYGDTGSADVYPGTLGDQSADCGSGCGSAGGNRNASVGSYGDPLADDRDCRRAGRSKLRSELSDSVHSASSAGSGLQGCPASAFQGAAAGSASFRRG
jgi:hypothetical protein